MPTSACSSCLPCLYSSTSVPRATSPVFSATCAGQCACVGETQVGQHGGGRQPAVAPPERYCRQFPATAPPRLQRPPGRDGGAAVLCLARGQQLAIMVREPSLAHCRRDRDAGSSEAQAEAEAQLAEDDGSRGEAVLSSRRRGCRPAPPPGHRHGRPTSCWRYRLDSPWVARHLSRARYNASQAFASIAHPLPKRVQPWRPLRQLLSRRQAEAAQILDCVAACAAAVASAVAAELFASIAPTACLPRAQRAARRSAAAGPAQAPAGSIMRRMGGEGARMPMRRIASAHG